MRFVGQHTHVGCNPGVAQLGHATPGDQRVGIAHRCHYPSEACAHQRIRARRCAAMVAARLQRHVGGCAAHVVATFAGIAQRHDLGMRLSCRLGKAGANHFAVAHDHAADTRIWSGDVHALARPLEREAHAIDVVDDVHVEVWTNLLSQGASSLPSQLSSRAGLHTRARPAMLILMRRTDSSWRSVNVPKRATVLLVAEQARPMPL